MSITPIRDQSEACDTFVYTETSQPVRLCECFFFGWIRHIFERIKYSSAEGNGKRARVYTKAGSVHTVQGEVQSQEQVLHPTAVSHIMNFGLVRQFQDEIDGFVNEVNQKV